jgi:hypothetical protein
MLKTFQKSLAALNDSKVFAGIIMILVNIGSKYITVKLSKSQEAYIRNYVAREILIFAACWMGTHDIVMSLLLTAAFFVLTQHLFNEESSMCILPAKFKEFHKMKHDEEVSEDEIREAETTLKKAKANKMHKFLAKNKI